MKKFLSLLSFMLLSIVLLNSCRNPAYEMNVLFDADVIKYKATIFLKGANGEALPNNITVEASGTDGESIYDFSGTKKIYATAGMISLGVTPKDIPTASKTLSFNIKISAPGYEDKNIEMTIAENQFSQVVDVTLLKTITTTPASVVQSIDRTLSPTGATTAAFTLTTPGNGTVPQSTSITVPAGTQFEDANGQVVVGSTVTARAINFDPADPLSIELFPAGSLNSSNVLNDNGQVVEAFFLPAGFTDIQMFVNGVEIKSFSTPINISIQIDPTFIPQEPGGRPVAAGDKLAIYAYRTESGQFTYEGEGTVAMVGGKPTVSFSTDHLTVFIVGDVIEKPAGCTDPVITYVAPWLGVGSQPMTVAIYDVDNQLLASRTVEVRNGLVDTWEGLPSGIALKYRISSQETTPRVLAEGTIANSCSVGNFSLTIGEPSGPPVDNITLVLNVNCTGKGPVVIPNFTLAYRVAGTTGAYTLLGTAEKGVIKTAALKIGTRYDFRAVWGSQVKEVKNHEITALDMSTVVGEAIGENLGSKAPETNRALLIEACKTATVKP